MGFFKNLFTWWDGATTGTALYSWRNGRKVGSDELGNVYFERQERPPPLGDVQRLQRCQPGAARMVCLADPPDRRRARQGAAAAAQIPASRRRPICTGTAEAYRPTGALERGGRRAAASGDYQAWTPD